MAAPRPTAATAGKSRPALHNPHQLRILANLRLFDIPVSLWRVTVTQSQPLRLDPAAHLQMAPVVARISTAVPGRLTALAVRRADTAVPQLLTAVRGARDRSETAQ